MRPLKILMASQVYADGNGQGGFALRLAENLAAHGHEVRVLMPSDRGGSYTQMMNGVKVEKVAAVHMSVVHPAVYVTPWPSTRVRAVFEEFQPDIVHLQDHYFLSMSVARAARRRGIPLVGTNHFLPENLLPFLIQSPILCDLAGRVLWVIMLSVFNHVDAATTPSNAAAAILRGQKIRFPVQAITNGVDTERFTSDPATDRAAIRKKYGLAPDRPIFFYVGRLDGEKRVDIMVEAAGKLPRGSFQLAIAGSGLKEQALKNQVRRLGLEKDVTFLGYVDAGDLPALYTSTDIFVMPSSAELQSIATLEAMSCGKPVLAANARALPELVEHGLNGYLFRSDDAEDAAHWMAEFLKEPGRWAEMGQAGFARSRAHGLLNSLQGYLDFYQSVIEKRNKKEN